MSDRDCQHGQLTRACDRCADAAEIERLRAEIERLNAGRHEMQAAGTHPAPCARHCEAKAFEIEIRRLRHDIEHHVRIATEATQEAERLRAELDEWEKLRDPAVLHASLCRGVPAQLDRDALLHLAGVEQLRTELAVSREREARMRALIADIKAWDISRFMAIPHELRARMEAALAEGAQE